MTSIRCELRSGRWQIALEDVEQVDVLICDPPYSSKTHGGQKALRRGGHRDSWASVGGISYAPWTERDVLEFCEYWSPRTSGWFCAMTDHVLAPVYIRALSQLGRYAFHPLPCVIPGMNVRLLGDGPSSWAIYLIVARPRTAAMSRWGTLPGSYTGKPINCGNDQSITSRPVTGGKTVELMRAIVSDYSRPGDLICDPCAGGATTLLAARLEGRHSIGSEANESTYQKALARLAELPGADGRQTSLFESEVSGG